ncbi:Retrovirus-related Pol polyprotein from transposon 297, partial [Frankliniella fusca]
MRVCDSNIPNATVKYLGHKVSAAGLRPLADRVQYLLDAPAPENVPQLQSFLGKMAFYDRFLPNRAAICASLDSLLEKDK